MKKILGLTAIAMASLFAAVAQETGDLPQGGVISIPLATTPGSLNPILPGELAQSIIGWTLYSPLTAINPWTIEVEPYLAESWTVSDDLREWTFYIRGNAVWHDGVPVTATDVKFTFDSIRDPRQSANTFNDFVNVEEIVVVDDKTVTVRLEQPDAWFGDRLALGGNEIIPHHVLSGFDLLADATEFNTSSPVGSGAFRMKNASPGAYYELEANPDFFLGAPNLDGIIFRVVPDGNTRVTELLTGALDWVDIEPTQLAAVRNNPRVNVVTFDSMGYQLFGWNLLEEKFQDVRVRIAMMHAVDRRQLVDSVSPGLGYLNDTYIPESFGWFEQPDLPFREYDPERALELLAEAGWVPGADGILQKDGEKFEFTILVDRGDVQREQMGLILQQFFTDLGMIVHYDLAERGGRWLEQTNEKTFESRLAAFPVTSVDWLQRLYASWGGNNGQSYNSPETDELITALLATADRGEQADILYRLQEVWYADPPNMVLLYRERMTASNANLGNIPPNNIKDTMPYAFMLYLNQ